MRPLIGTSWKMNLTATQAAEWFSTFVPLADDLTGVDLFVLPPFTSLWLAREWLAGSSVAWGAQDVSPLEDGPHTGDISASMLADLGCRFVEVGHADRRRDHGETPAVVSLKIRAALRAGMDAIVCTGERERVADDDAFAEVVRDLERCLDGVSASDFSRLVIAYEPMWAIGAGKSPASAGRVGRIHRAVAEWFRAQTGGTHPRIVYGGSVDAVSASRLFEQAGVDGLFVGRNGLDPAGFTAIARASQATARELSR